MDLGTVKKNLDSRAYRTVEDFKNVNIFAFFIVWRWLTLIIWFCCLEIMLPPLSSLIMCTSDSFVCIKCISGHDMNSLLCTVYRINAQVWLITGYLYRCALGVRIGIRMDWIRISWAYETESRVGTYPGLRKTKVARQKVLKIGCS